VPSNPIALSSGLLPFPFAVFLWPSNQFLDVCLQSIYVGRAILGDLMST
jgi:hypothetical protein